MQIQLHEITIKELTTGYINNQEEGVIGLNGKLNIRPKYQREFVYDDKKRNAVIETIKKDFPLNVMYFVENEDNTLEVLDGQQRTISICEYVEGNFSLENRYFHNLTDTEKNQILDYKLMVYFCKGTDKEKLDWFQTINIAGEKLTPQELRNAVYTGEWLTDAKRHFSKSTCPAYGLGEKYMTGSPIRQEYLEKVISWINNGKIEEYMSIHQHNKDANEIWQYFQDVIAWIKKLFPDYRKEQKGLEWGVFFNKYKNNLYNTNTLKTEVEKLMQDDDVTSKKGIYEYLLSGDEKHLSIRTFSDTQKRQVYETQGGICALCIKKGKSKDESHFEINQMEADHITPWSQGGKTSIDNCQMLCRECNRRKSDK
ncbi:DUF262 domain-containing protein [Candidatus Gracilibacteria bacterium]|nr:DUF262 domain-containing protein [Candidatus Gracilibacteria bacterium]